MQAGGNFTSVTASSWSDRRLLPAYRNWSVNAADGPRDLASEVGQVRGLKTVG